MVSKCANPACKAPFLYFHQGKLFRREGSLAHEANGNPNRNPPRRVEFYWLCSDCADKMTLAFEKGVGVLVRPRPMIHSTAA